MEDLQRLIVQIGFVHVPEDGGGFLGQGAVQEYRRIVVTVQQPAGFYLPQGVQQFLGPAHGEGGYHHIPAPIQRPLQKGGKI